MASFPVCWVDAFTDRPLAGNACAVVFDADGLDAATMLAIAAEMHLSETAFVRRSSIADVAARYFTPAEEIPLAGHPTIATIHALVDSRRLPLKGERTTISLELKEGPIPVEIVAPGGRVSRIVMTQRKPRFLATHDPAVVLPIFGLDPAAVLPGVPIRTVSTGTPQLMVPLNGLAALRRATLDIPGYQSYREHSDFFSPHLFCLEGATPDGQTFARHFGTPPDTLEDPFTGSATGGMAAFCWHYGLLESPRFRAEQGHWMGRPGMAEVEVVGPRHDIETVRVGGTAVTLMRGELTI
ncbi:MAG TPA: PhzF family phenazine biosynthesis protein [Gemmatimonadales bacterium]|nr:PhzF family phenazine biosynthesis protein [Gemmatimonadales bacterium]